MDCTGMEVFFMGIFFVFLIVLVIVDDILDGRMRDLDKGTISKKEVSEKDVAAMATGWAWFILTYSLILFSIVFCIVIL